MKRLFLIFLLALSFSGCGKYIVHPGATSLAESKAYDVVNDAHNIIDVTRPQLASGALNARFKPAFNKLVDAYNVAFPALQAYHDAINKGIPADQALMQLVAAQAALNAALSEFKGVK